MSLQDITTMMMVRSHQHNQNQISNEVRASFYFKMNVFVLPSISFFGILGNLTSVVVITKNGLQKSSNILLIALAVADLCFLIGSNNYIRLIYTEVGGFGFYYERSVSYTLYIFYNLIHILYFMGTFCSLTIPVLITLDRFLAVFFPLRFKSIVTVRRTQIAVLSVYGFYSIVTVYILFAFEFVYVHRNSRNESVGFIDYTSLVQHVSYGILDQIVNALTQTIPFVLVFVGCVLIGIKVNVANAKRKDMTLSSDGPRSKPLVSRTTRSLMAVCTVYCITAGVGYVLFSYEPPDYNLELILQQVRILVLCINSSCNFLIYVASNRNFRLTLMGGMARDSKST